MPAVAFPATANYFLGAVMEIVMTDRLTLTRAFEDADIKSEAAERIATAIYDAIHENVATKTDLRELEQRLDRRIDHMVNRLASVIVIVAGVLFAALHYWPPHG